MNKLPSRLVNQISLALFIFAAPIFAAPPSNVWWAWRGDLAHAYHYYLGARPDGCPLSVFAHGQNYEAYVQRFPNQIPVANGRTRFLSPALRPRLTDEGNRVRREVFPRLVRASLANWRTISDDRVPVGILADMLEDNYDGPAIEILRAGLGGLPPLPTTEEDAYLAFRRLFYLIKINRIPQFLLSSGVFQFSEDDASLFGLYHGGTWLRAGQQTPDKRVYFHDDIFYGAEVSAYELSQPVFQNHFHQAPTFEYLAIDIGHGELEPALGSETMRRVRSLDLRMGYQPTTGPYLGSGGPAPDVAPPQIQLPELTRLTISPREDRNNEVIAWTLKRRALAPSQMPRLREIHLENLIRPHRQALTELPENLRAAVARFADRGVVITWSYRIE